MEGRIRASSRIQSFHWYDKNLKSFTISRLFDHQKSAIHPFHKIIPQNDKVQKEIQMMPQYIFYTLYSFLLCIGASLFDELFSEMIFDYYLLGWEGKIVYFWNQQDRH